jgi:catechol 2,3-dioxygenase-like lactoylglutathione lyase family enzyme
MIRGIHHTGISTGDLDRALAFYRDLLGLEVAVEFRWPAGTEVADRITGLNGSSARVAVLKAGNAMIELFQYESPPSKRGDPDRPVSDQGITHIALDVTDVDAEYERLQASGVKFHSPPQDFGVVKATYARDPDGNVIELQEILYPNSPIALAIE